jgi:hypothetical protein
MSSPWFRFYDEVLNDPKVQSLDGDTFKVWVNLLCVTSRCDGHIFFDDISFHLRMGDKEALAYCVKLADKDLLIPTEHGYIPNAWDKRQYKTDTSAERTKAYRERKKIAKRDGGVTSHVTPPDTDTETDTEIKNYTKKSNQKISKPDEVSEQVWLDFLQLRKAKRASLTATALEGIRREAVKAGLSLNDALATSCRRGWQGFEAVWLQNEKLKPGGHFQPRRGEPLKQNVVTL